MYISTTEVQISYADTDMMGIIYHANYLIYFELGRTHLVRELGYSYTEMERSGFSSPVLKAELTYKKPLRYGDRVFVKSWVEQNDGFKTKYGYEVVNGDGELCASGSTLHIVVRKDNFRPVRFMNHFPDWFQKYEEIKSPHPSP